MRRKEKDLEPRQTDDLNAMERELSEELGDFKSSMTAWSEAMMSRPRALTSPSGTNWQLVTKWALGCVVFAGTVSGGLFQNHRQEESTRVAAAAAARAEEQQRKLAAQEAMDQSPEDLMAKVDSDVAREVPSALEPLASLMSDEGN